MKLMRWLQSAVSLLAFVPHLGNEHGQLTLENGWVYRWGDTINLVYQQSKTLIANLLNGTMIHRGVRAAIDYHERMGAAIANPVIDPYGQTQQLNPNRSRRGCLMQSFDASVLVSDEDTLRSMIDPTAANNQTIINALIRRTDLNCINALIGLAMVTTTSRTDASMTFTTQAMLSSHIIGTGVAIDLDTVVNAGELLSKAGVPQGPENRAMLYSPGQERDIMAITQASSSDFTSRRIHDAGTINGQVWQGFLWVSIADVLDEATNVLQRMLPLTSTTRSCIAFARTCLGMSTAKEIGTKVSARPDLNDCVQTRATMIQGQVRVWEGGVVQVDVLEN